MQCTAPIVLLDHTRKERKLFNSFCGPNKFSDSENRLTELVGFALAVRGVHWLFLVTGPGRISSRSWRKPPIDPAAAVKERSIDWLKSGRPASIRRLSNNNLFSDRKNNMHWKLRNSFSRRGWLPHSLTPKLTDPQKWTHAATCTRCTEKPYHVLTSVGNTALRLTEQEEKKFVRRHLPNAERDWIHMSALLPVCVPHIHDTVKRLTDWLSERVNGWMGFFSPVCPPSQRFNLLEIEGATTFTFNTLT